MVAGVKGWGGRLLDSVGILSKLRRWSSFTKFVPWGANLRVTVWWSLIKLRKDVAKIEQAGLCPRM